MPDERHKDFKFLVRLEGFELSTPGFQSSLLRIPSCPYAIKT